VSAAKVRRAEDGVYVTAPARLGGGALIGALDLTLAIEDRAVHNDEHGDDDSGRGDEYAALRQDGRPLTIRVVRKPKMTS
jgi:hypothetical protein